MIQIQGRCLLFLIILLTYLTLNCKQINAEVVDAVIGTNITLSCKNPLAENVYWTRNGQNISATDDKRYIATQQTQIIPNEEDFDNTALNQEELIYQLNIINIVFNDTGNYTCYQVEEDKVEENHYQLQSVIPPRIVAHGPKQIRTKISTFVQLYCLFEAHPMERFAPSIVWTKDDDVTFMSKIGNRSQIVPLNETFVNVTLEISDVSKKDNGTYVCSIQSSYAADVSYHSTVLVLEKPQVSIDYVKAVGAKQIYLNWTVNDGNDPVQKYFVRFKKDNATSISYYSHSIDGSNTSHVLKDFEPNSYYLLELGAKNSIGDGEYYHHPIQVKTLESDPVFIPKVSVKGNTHSTITIGWSPPPPNLLEYIHYYEVVGAKASDNSPLITEAIHQQNSRNLPYMFDNLSTFTEYKFKVRACSELTKICGNWSEEVTGTTMDGTSSEPLNLNVSCMHYNISGRTTIVANWDPPEKPNGHITSYHMVVSGLATFISESGNWKNETYGPKAKNVNINEKVQRADYENVPVNTNFTISVSGVTRSKRPGDPAKATCTMPPTEPDTLGRYTWGKFEKDGIWVFKLFLPKISQRNGPICGYRIYLVRIPKNVNRPLPDPQNMEIFSYEHIHAANNTQGGAYLAEVIPSDADINDIILGDGKNIIDNTLIDKHSNSMCKKLLRGKIIHKHRVIRTTIAPVTIFADEDGVDIPIPQTPLPPPPLQSPNSTQKERLEKAGNLTSEATKILNSKNRRRRKRQHLNNFIPNDEEEKKANALSTVPPPATVPTSLPTPTLAPDSYVIVDGLLDPKSNYTGFIEVIVNTNDEDGIITTTSEFLETRSAGPSPSAENADENLTTILQIVTQVLCGLILLVLVLLIALYFWQRYSKNAAQGDEAISLRDSLSRAFCGGRSNHNHRHLIGTAVAKPTDIGPITRIDLPQAYVNRHKDTDYGFLREYEILPNRFNDRTTKHSDATENVYKNRYPDIKAYDQTRVRLAERNGTIGSDYINANFVLGYKERKKFICAQGPMDSTVNDFWRMIWEQHLEIIVMLTNLEEYNKAKCAKYWPEKIDDSTKFGEITVTFLEEQRFSDYLIRDLKVTRRNSNGSNGTAGGSGSNEDDEERRHITQYHYLVWKDFMAPEHPHGIIKFIRQINSVYSLQRGPILVHCSAGVGRTGTLVALDSLMQQLEDENQVSIFNTVCDMRHQRNFLVQSLKQYIFLYRALLDLAQFGNTELPAKELNAAVENLKARISDSKEQCKLEIEFERIKSITDDTNKTCAVGNSEENRSKNRSELVIPYDRNRVILTPIPGREHSTYINASFIEGYDNSESFIITQDPMDDTIGDFWRMIFEQGINTIIMISEIGDGPKKCPRYWADDEIQYDHILVKYMQSESCPYYTRREFNVTNCKMKDTIKVTQFQYNGWPTVEGEVPEVARGMIELVDQAQNHHNSEATFASIGPIAVHCNLGTERSSIYVALCILIQHLRTEKKVDICTTTRKLRSQRSMLLDSYAQYEFVHRAIVNYADLHRLSLDLPSDC